MTPELRRVLEDAFPGEEARYFAPMSIGGTPSVADSGATAILDGIKTATSSARWHYPDGRIPFAGALSILLDGQGRARAIVETEPSASRSCPLGRSTKTSPAPTAKGIERSPGGGRR